PLASPHPGDGRTRLARAQPARVKLPEMEVVRLARDPRPAARPLRGYNRPAYPSPSVVGGRATDKAGSRRRLGSAVLIGCAETSLSPRLPPRAHRPRVVF